MANPKSVVSVIRNHVVGFLHGILTLQNLFRGSMGPSFDVETRLVAKQAPKKARRNTNNT